MVFFKFLLSKNQYIIYLSFTTALSNDSKLKLKYSFEYLLFITYNNDIGENSFRGLFCNFPLLSLINPSNLSKKNLQRHYNKTTTFQTDPQAFINFKIIIKKFLSNFNIIQYHKFKYVFLHSDFSNALLMCSVLIHLIYKFFNKTFKFFSFKIKIIKDDNTSGFKFPNSNTIYFHVNSKAK